MSVRLNPYLSFRDNAREAMTFYHSVFGGELTVRPSPSSTPAPTRPRSTRSCTACSRPPMVSCSWAQTHRGHGVRPGRNLHIAQRRRRGQIARLLGAPERGRHRRDAVREAPWGDTFGMCIDQFGISWMVNIAAQST